MELLGASSAIRLLKAMVKEAGESCAVVVLAGSCLFSIITAISLPGFYNADVSRINFNEVMQNATGGIDQVRVGALHIQVTTGGNDLIHSFT